MKISATENLTNSRIYFGKSKYFIEPGMVNVSIPDDGIALKNAKFYASKEGGQLIKIEGATQRRAPATKNDEQPAKPKAPAKRSARGKKASTSNK